MHVQPADDAQVTYKRTFDTVTGTCAKCGHHANHLSWMSRVEAYLCNRCWRKVLGLK